ncbi:hypothetical protein SLS59_007924 [Nothophoma quercina]|uniref:Uncharacterized protein n=1 Tax=Nothophoma quercina TaxID=749835 RepID=A0ABR3QVR6_9PLEO
MSTVEVSMKHGRSTGGDKNDLAAVRTLSRIQAKVESLSGQQEQLAESRGEILISREDFIQKSKYVREQRDQTANAEVKFMNVLRKHYNSLNTPFPIELDAAYLVVDDERNKLGSLEVEHMDTADELGAQEWAFMEQENDLYQFELRQLFDDDTDLDEHPQQIVSSQRTDPIAPSVSVQYQVATVEHSRLVDRFRAMRRSIADIIDVTILSADDAKLLDPEDIAPSFSELLTQLADCEATAYF